MKSLLLLPVETCNSLWLGISYFKSIQSKNVDRMQANYMYAYAHICMYYLTCFKMACEGDLFLPK